MKRDTLEFITNLMKVVHALAYQCLNTQVVSVTPCEEPKEEQSIEKISENTVKKEESVVVVVEQLEKPTVIETKKEVVQDLRDAEPSCESQQPPDHIKIEEYEEVVEAKNDRRESHCREHNQEYPMRGQEFKRRGYPQCFSQGRNDLATNKNSQGKGREKQIVAASDVLSCQRCGDHHPNRPCHYGSGLCYNCGKLGHLVRDCPHRKDRETARSDFHT
nr:uncharacterized protein LOC112779500 [Arachis hypogaea]